MVMVMVYENLTFCAVRKKSKFFSDGIAHQGPPRAQSALAPPPFQTLGPANIQVYLFLESNSKSF